MPKIVLYLDNYALQLIDEFINLENQDIQLKTILNKCNDSMISFELKEDLDKLAYKIKNRRMKIADILLLKLVDDIGNQNGVISVQIDQSTIEEYVILKNKLADSRMKKNQSANDLEKYNEHKEYLVVELTEHTYDFVHMIATQIGYIHDQFTNEYKLKEEELQS